MSGTTVTILALCAKTASNVGWFVNYLQNMEIFPTTARMSGMNLAATISVALGISAPYVVLLVILSLFLVCIVVGLLVLPGFLAVAAHIVIYFLHAAVTVARRCCRHHLCFNNGLITTL